MKILCFLPNWVGDAVMATPALRALRTHFRDAHIIGLCKASVADVFVGNDRLDEVLPCETRAVDPAHRPWSTIRRLRGARIDAAVLFTNSMRSALLAWAVGARKRVGYARDGRGWLLNERLYAPRAKRVWEPTPIIDYYLKLAYHLGAEPTDYRMELATTDADERRADDLWERCGFHGGDTVVALNPGAAFGPAKRWPSDSFVELARRLADRRIKSLVLCGPKERGFAKYIAERALRPKLVKSLADEQVSLGLSKAIVKRAALLVTTDSGPRHFAAAFGRPVVSLFGPTHQRWTDTYHPLETALQREVPCGPCQQRECPLGHHRCMKELSVDEVAVAALRALGELTSRPGFVA